MGNRLELFTVLFQDRLGQRVQQKDSDERTKVRKGMGDIL